MSGELITLQPGLTTVAELSPLLRHPDIAADTVPSFHIDRALTARVMMGRVALARDPSGTAFNDWTLELAHTIVDLDTRPKGSNIELAELWGSLVEMYVHGAAAGSPDAETNLSVMLQNDLSGSRLRRAMKVCADLDLDPDPWMARIAEPNQAAHGWTAYIDARDYDESGKVRTSEELTTPELAEAIRGFMHPRDNGYSDSTIIAFARTALRVAPYDQKQHIIDKFIHTSARMLMPITDEDELNEPNLRNMVQFNTQVQLDPDIPSQTKDRMDLHTHAMVLSLLLDATAQCEQTIAHLVGTGATPETVSAQIDSWQEPETGAMRFATREHYLALAAKGYIRTGQPNKAAGLLPTITTQSIWTAGVHDYMDHHGSSDWLRLAHSGLMFSDKTSDISLEQTDTVRERYIALVDTIRRAPQSRLTAYSAVLRLQELATTLGENAPPHEADIVVRGMSRLFEMVPSVASHFTPEIRDHILGAIEPAARDAALIEMTRRRVPGASEVMWKQIQDKHQEGGGLNHAVYFLRYAQASLADTISTGNAPPATQ